MLASHLIELPSSARFAAPVQPRLGSVLVALHQVPDRADAVDSLRRFAESNRFTKHAFVLFTDAQFHPRPGPLPLTAVRIPAGLAYGERQKLVLDFARRRNFDVVLCTPLDQPCDLDSAASMLEPVLAGRADMTIGTRLTGTLTKTARSLGWIGALGNLVSSALNRRLIGSARSDVHSTYRAIRLSALRGIPFDQNSSDRRFDMELLIQFHTFSRRIVDVPVAALCCRSRSLSEGFGHLRAAVGSGLRFFLHQKGFLFHPPFDNKQVPYRLRTDRFSVHHRIVNRIPCGSRVLDLGCSDGYVAGLLKQKGCRVVGVDLFDSAAARSSVDEFYVGNLDDLGSVAAEVDFTRFDYVIALDVIEHLSNPEDFLRTLRANVCPGCHVLLSTANIAYFVVRLMLLLGQFNYGKRGILDITHKRLFTKSTFARAARVSGYDVDRIRGVPPPAHYVVPNPLGGWITAAHAVLSRILPSWFGFQIILVLTPRLTLEQMSQLLDAEPLEKTAMIRRRRRMRVNAVNAHPFVHPSRAAYRTDVVLPHPTDSA